MYTLSIAFERIVYGRNAFHPRRRCDTAILMTQTPLSGGVLSMILADDDDRMARARHAATQPRAPWTRRRRRKHVAAIRRGILRSWRRARLAALPRELCYRRMPTKSARRMLINGHTPVPRFYAAYMRRRRATWLLALENEVQPAIAAGDWRQALRILRVLDTVDPRPGS
jgi:hypothetical protein